MKRRWPLTHRRNLSPCHPIMFAFNYTKNALSTHNYVQPFIFSPLEPRVGQVLQLRSHYSPTPTERTTTHACAYQWYRSATRSSSVLFREFRVMPRISQMFTDEYGNPTSIQMKIAQAWEVEDEQIPGGRRSIPRKMSVEEVAALIDQTMVESITRRNSVLRRGTVIYFSRTVTWDTMINENHE